MFPTDSLRVDSFSVDSFMAAARRGQRAIVVGGGLVGLMSAAELHLAGFDVTVFDASEFARQASWAGGGILCPLAPWDEPVAVWRQARHSMARTRAWIEGPLAEYPIEWWASGIEWLELDDAALDWLVREFDDVRIARTDSQQQRLATIPSIAQVRTPRYGQALCHWLMAQGVDLRAQCPVDSVDARKVVTRAGQTHAADVVCVAAGPWTSRLVPSVDVVPIRGQMLLFPAGTAQAIGLRRIRCRGHQYVIPRKDGQVLAGSTSEKAGFVVQVDDAGEALIRDALETLAPALVNVPHEHAWAGLRPCLSVGEQTAPMVGSIASDLGEIWINAGHFRNGVTLAAGSAQLLAAQVCTASR